MARKAKHPSMRRPHGHGSIQSRKDRAGKTVYYSSHRDLESGKQIQEPFRLLRDAHAYLDTWSLAKRDRDREREAAEERGEGAAPPREPGNARNWTLADLLQEWRVREYANVRVSTWRNRDASISSLNRELGTTRVDALQADDLEAYVYLCLTGYQLGWKGDPKDHPRVPQLARSYVRQHLLLVRTALDRAVLLGIRRDNPGREISLPRPDQREVPILRPEQMRELVAAMPERHRLAVHLMAELGLRIGEAFGARISDYDPAPDRRMLRLEQQLAEQARGRSELTQLKTLRSRRALKVSDRLHEAIMGQIAYLQDKPNTYGLLCPNRLGGLTSTSNWRRRTFHPVCDQLGLSDKVTPHVLRHSIITIWAQEREVSMMEISRRAGHSSVGFTVSRYGHVSEAELMRAYDPLAQS